MRVALGALFCALYEILLSSAFSLWAVGSHLLLDGNSSRFCGGDLSGKFLYKKRLGLVTTRQKKSTFREYFEAIVIAVLLALFIRTFIVQAFKIPSGSMLPTLLIGDHLLVNKFIYGIRMPFTGQLLIPIKQPKRGDVVVFRFPKDRSIDYIKRVIGVPGDTVEIKDKKVYINDKAIADPHAHFSSPTILNASASPRDNFGPVLVPEGRIFVMGDNRDNSYDSRFWGFVDQREILGKAFILYWSWDIDKPLLSVDRFTSIRWNRMANLID
jgi:signal peptidase I